MPQWSWPWLWPQYGLFKLNLTFLRTATGHETGCADLHAHCGCAGPVLPRLSQQGAEFARTQIQLFAQADEQVEQPGDLQLPTSSGKPPCPHHRYYKFSSALIASWHVYIQRKMGFSTATQPLDLWSHHCFLPLLLYSHCFELLTTEKFHERLSWRELFRELRESYSNHFQNRPHF